VGTYRIPPLAQYLLLNKQYSIAYTYLSQFLERPLGINLALAICAAHLNKKDEYGELIKTAIYDFNAIGGDRDKFDQVLESFMSVPG